MLAATTACAFPTAQLPKVLRQWCYLSNPVLRATTPCTFCTSQLPKVLRTCCVFSILTSKCALHHNGVHFFDISTSKSAPSMVCFARFDLEIVVRATTVCTFSTSQLPQVLRRWCVFSILPSNFASGHNSVQFLISHLPRWLRTRRFSKATFRPSGATKQWKNTASQLFYLFARVDLLSSDSFSSPTSSSDSFSSLPLSTPAASSEL